MEVAPGIAMATALGDIRYYPRLGWEWAARMAVQTALSGAAASGLKLRALTISMCLPGRMDSDDLTTFWRAVHREAEKASVPVLSNSTSMDPGNSFPFAGTCMAIATGLRENAVSPGTVKDGDLIVMTGSAGVEAAAVLALARREEIAEVYGDGFAEDAAELVRQISTVPHAQVAYEFGLGTSGVTAMSNPGSGGLLRALYWLAEWSEVGIRVDRSALVLSDDVDAICSHFGLDPLIAPTQGALLLSCRSESWEELQQRFEAQKISAGVIGEASLWFRGLEIADEGRVADPAEYDSSRLAELLREPAESFNS